MTYPHTTHLSTRLRLLCGLALLIGLCALTGGLTRPAHAAPAATLFVTDCSGETGSGRIGTVISSASAGDTITFSCSGTIPISSTLNISKNLTLDGSGQTVTLDGGGSTQVLSVDSGVTFTLNALTIAHGHTLGNGGGLANNTGTVSISNSVFTGNSVPTNQWGGAIYSTGFLTISNSTFTNTSGYFGTVYNTGNVDITNSTFAGNNPSYGGGGLFNDIKGTATITNSTIANNTAYGFVGGSIFVSVNGARVNISGSIVANNSGGDCQNHGIITDQGYNLDSDSSCFTASMSLHTNPQLSGLADNGGPTQTMALQQGSPAIDAIPLSANVCPSTDQRGDPRPDVDAPAETMCDMGAYESTSSAVDDDLGLTNIPSNITTNATSPQGATVSYTPPTVVDEDSPLPPVNCSPASGTTFAIGTTTVTCTATDSDDSNSPVSRSFTVTVKPTLSTSGTSVSATEGRSFSGVVVATGADYGAGTLSATIDWSDGQTSTGSVSLATDGSYSVKGSHVYDEEGPFAIKVMVSASGGQSATASSSASVADAALTANTPTAVINKLAVSLSTVFFDANPNGTASDYSATITWGDGKSSTGAISMNSTNFTATGSHTYSKHATYTVTVTIKDAGGSTVTKTLSVKV